MNVDINYIERRLHAGDSLSLRGVSRSLVASHEASLRLDALS